MALTVTTKLAKDLNVGDVVIRIDTIAIPPVLLYIDDKPHVHLARVASVTQAFEEPVVADPESADTLAEFRRLQAEAANAAPNAGRRIAECVITIHGYENDERSDQNPVEYRQRALDVVEVLEGDLVELLVSEWGE